MTDDCWIYTDVIQSFVVLIADVLASTDGLVVSTDVAPFETELVSVFESSSCSPLIVGEDFDFFGYSIIAGSIKMILQHSLTGGSSVVVENFEHYSPFFVDRSSLEEEYSCVPSAFSSALLLHRNP